MKRINKIISLILSVIIIFSAVSVNVFADEADFGYYFANDSETAVYIKSFNGNVPKNGYIDIPETIDGYTVTGITENAFTKISGIKGIIIPDTLVFIDEKAFGNEIDVKVKQSENDNRFNTENWYDDHKNDYVIKGSTLVSYKGNDEIVTIPYNCAAIADEAFKNNKKIKVVYFEKEIKKIGNSAFEGCISLENIVAGNGVKSIEIGKNAFKGTPWLENFPSEFVTISSTLVKYKGSASYVKIPNVFTSIAQEAFCNLDNNGKTVTKIKVPYSIETLGKDCFCVSDSDGKVYPELVVFKDSAAEAYCKKEKIDFINGALPGDVDGDGRTSASDARYVLRVAAKLEKPIRDVEIKEVADISGDSRISAEDARLVLRLAAKLDEYSAKELLSIPRTAYEILFEATKTISIARDYGAAYSMLKYQEITKSDVNSHSKIYLDMYKNELTSEKKSRTVNFAGSSEEAYKNLYPISLIDSSKVKEYSTVLKDGIYKYTLVLSDEKFSGKDVEASSFTSKMFPVEKVSHFTNKAKTKFWYNESLDYNMTYNNCKLELKVDAETNKIISIYVEMNYDFEITGKISGIKVSGINGPATATRTDVIKYTNFNYFL